MSTTPPGRCTRSISKRSSCWRRTVPALFVAYFAARLFVDTWLRQRLTPPLSLIRSAHENEPAVLRHAWVISEHPSDRLGATFHPQIGACGGSIEACFANGGYMHAVYEPATRFWTMQLVEFGLLAGIAVALIAFSAWRSDQRV